jgi:hypothetical protein
VGLADSLGVYKTDYLKAQRRFSDAAASTDFTSGEQLAGTIGHRGHFDFHVYGIHDATVRI